jgi:DNA-binding response OmpR family regulator
MPKTRVLFVDDDATLQILASAMMNAGIFEVVSAKGTAEADKILARQTIDIIICDVMMPEEDGLAYCKRLRSSGNKIPLLMLSAVSDPKMIQQATHAGATDYLVKPFDIHALQKKLLAMLGKTPASKPTSSAHTPARSSGIMGWFRS